MCPVHGPKGEECREFNQHHIYHPRKAYKSKLERLFRGMFTVRICVDEHKHIHATTPPPKKPSAREMRLMIEARLAERKPNGG